VSPGTGGLIIDLSAALSLADEVTNGRDVIPSTLSMKNPRPNALLAIGEAIPLIRPIRFNLRCHAVYQFLFYSNLVSSYTRDVSIIQS